MLVIAYVLYVVFIATGLAVVFVALNDAFIRFIFATFYPTKTS